MDNVLTKKHRQPGFKTRGLIRTPCYMLTAFDGLFYSLIVNLTLMIYLFSKSFTIRSRFL